MTRHDCRVPPRATTLPGSEPSLGSTPRPRPYAGRAYDEPLQPGRCTLLVIDEVSYIAFEAEADQPVPAGHRQTLAGQPDPHCGSPWCALAAYLS
jgi:hypothetical protein